MTSNKLATLTGKIAQFVQDLLTAGATLDQVVVCGPSVIVIPKEPILEANAKFWMTTKSLTQTNLQKAITYATQGRLAYEKEHPSIIAKNNLPAEIRQLIEASPVAG